MGRSTCQQTMAIVGKSSQMFMTGTPVSCTVTSFTVTPDSFAYAGTWGQGFYESNDLGNSWFGGGYYPIDVGDDFILPAHKQFTNPFTKRGKWRRCSTRITRLHFSPPDSWLGNYSVVTGINTPP